jgi:hypothetical protein
MSRNLDDGHHITMQGLPGKYLPIKPRGCHGALAQRAIGRLGIAAKSICAAHHSPLLESPCIRFRSSKSGGGPADSGLSKRMRVKIGWPQD